MIQFLPTVKKEVLTVRVLRAKLGIGHWALGIGYWVLGIISPAPHPLDQ
ncbi:MAG: hypothetical protein ACYTXY_19420 [Nostoc sp.]